MNNFFDVIIIGFGPTGGTLASLLAKSNLSILLLDSSYRHSQKKLDKFQLR